MSVSMNVVKEMAIAKVILDDVRFRRSDNDTECAVAVCRAIINRGPNGWEEFEDDVTHLMKVSVSFFPAVEIITIEDICEVFSGADSEAVWETLCEEFGEEVLEAHGNQGVTLS
jgi:hypothetical protein